MTKVPLLVMSGKSPMKTVWDLISPVSLLVNSAVTKSGAAYVKSRSLHSSIEFFGGSKRWSRKVSDIDPEKSSIGEISSKISSRPDFLGTSCPLSRAASTRAFQAALPSSQSKLSVCSARRFGTSRGSLIFAKEMRSGAVLAPLFVFVVEALREAAKRGSFRGLGLTTRVPVPTLRHTDDRSPDQGVIQSTVLKRGHAPGDGQGAANRQRKGSV